MWKLINSRRQRKKFAVKTFEAKFADQTQDWFNQLLPVLNMQDKTLLFVQKQLYASQLYVNEYH